ncbi:MAG: glycosyltransferase family 39 protein, partial [Opitutales bacterium]
MDASASTSARPGYLVWLALFALAGYGVFLARHAAVQPGGSDSSGYFNTARLLAHGTVQAPMRALDGLPGTALPEYAYVPLGFRPDATQTRLVPTYPIGLPLFLLAAIRTVGPAHGPDLLLIAHALAGIWLMYALARTMGCGRPAASLGAALLAFSPLYLMYALHAMSDLPALVWVTAAIWLAWQSPRSNWLALAAGFALGVAVLLRPTNLLAMVPISLALGAAPRRWAGLVLGGLPCAVGLGVFNHAAYGSAFASGYTDVADLLSPRWVPVTLGHYARWLPVVASPLVLAALGLPWLWPRARRTVLVLGSWIVVWFGFYACYFHTHEYWW